MSVPEAPAYRYVPGVVVGRYRIARAIGVGGMASVFEAVHVDLESTVALKIMKPELVSGQVFVERFVQEARAASRLRHPHVVAVSDVGVDQGIPYLVMEYLEGEDLDQRLTREGRMPWQQAVDLLLPLVSAVSAAHDAGILHRDIKPANVLLARSRKGVKPVLLDFGISRPKNPTTHLTQHGQILGTPAYMAPEVLMGESANEASDLYALGALVYECVAGQLPFHGETFMQIFQAVTALPVPPLSSAEPTAPFELQTVVMRAMSRRPEDRYATVAELGRALWPMASPLVRAQWCEEMGDPEVLAQSLASPSSFGAARPEAPRAPSIPPEPALEPESLRVFPTFDGATDAELTDFLRATRTREVPAGARLIEQGTYGHCCFLLVSGAVEVQKRVADEEITIDRLGPGSVFGQIALIDHVPRTASVVTTEASIVVEIGRHAFEGLLTAQSNMALRFREHIAVESVRQLRRATKRFANLVAHGAHGQTPAQLTYVQAAMWEPSLRLKNT